MLNNQNKQSNNCKNEKERDNKYIAYKNPINLYNNINKHYHPNNFNLQNIFSNLNQQYKFNNNNNEKNKIIVGEQYLYENKANINPNIINNIIKANEKQSTINYNIQLYNKIAPCNKIDKNIPIDVNSNNNIPIILQNVGNTTYLNTVIRCLVCIIGFYNYYLENQHIIKNNQEKIPITYFFSRIIVHLFQSNGKNFYSLDKFHKILIYCNPIFRGKSTKNAIDFLIYLIGQLHEDYITINKKDNENSIREADCHNIEKYKQYLKEKEISNVFNEFSWISKNEEICWECNKKIITYKIFNTYDLDFEYALNKAILANKKEISILDCINIASEEKSIYNVFCENCSRKNNFKKKSTIYSSKKTFIFLIRGIEKKEIINEIRSYQIKIKINKNLNIYKKANTNKYYSLYGLILYDTEKLEYIAYCINPINKKWYKYTKEEVVFAELSDLLNKNDFQLFPTILFYRVNN